MPRCRYSNAEAREDPCRGSCGFPHHAPEYDPLEDGRKPFTREEFVATMKANLDEWAGEAWLNNDPRTFHDWLAIFAGYMSW